MVFGDKEIYAIEVYHEPTASYYMSGRMCLFLNGVMLGDIDDPCNVLGVTYSSLLKIVNDVDEVEIYKIRNNFNLITDKEIFDFFNTKLYIGDDYSSYEQVVADARKYGKFDFLTNGGEMFDGTKSFFYLDNLDVIHILYQFDDSRVCSARINKKLFLNVTSEFFKWFHITEGLSMTK